MVPISFWAKLFSFQANLIPFQIPSADFAFKLGIYNIYTMIVSVKEVLLFCFQLMSE